MSGRSEETHPLILVVDDDENILELLRLYFVREGFRVTFAADGEQAMAAIDGEAPDLVVLDLMLPGLSGWEVCRRIRERGQLPVIMLTARGDATDRVAGLEMGADDYVPKPFDPNELVARVKAVLRRSGGRPGAGETAATGPTAPDLRATEARAPASAQGEELVRLPGLQIDREAHTVHVNGEPVQLTPKEFELLWCLARRPGRVYTRDQLLAQVWGYEYGGDARTLDVHVNKLRSKCENPSQPWRIKTIWGVGYKLEVDR